jgi:hypothetical protein
MESRKVDGLILLYDSTESEAARIVEEACLRGMRVIEETWGLLPPEDCRVYIMTSWIQFLRASAPWGWRLLLAVTFPLWAFRTQRLWRYAGGWAQRYGRRQAVGIKPPRLMEVADRSIGRLLFIPEADMLEKVRHVTCHELTHACTAHLRLPSWMNEGVAMVTVDRFFGKPTIRQDTLDILESHHATKRPADSARLNPADKPAVLRYYARGYWIVRLLAETDQRTIREILQARWARTELEERIAVSLGTTREALWREVDGILRSRFAPASSSG